MLYRLSYSRVDREKYITDSMGVQRISIRLRFRSIVAFESNDSFTPIPAKLFLREPLDHIGLARST